MPPTARNARYVLSKPPSLSRPRSGVDVQHDIEDDDFKELIREIFSNPAYRGKTIVIYWHHQKLPEIAALLGAPPGSFPDPWSEDLYNVVLDFRYDPNTGAAPAVTRLVEPF